MTTTKNNEHKKLNFSNEREQSQACLNSAEHEKNQGRKVLNVPNLRFPEFQGEWEKQKLCDISSIVGRIGFRGYTTNDIVEKGMGAIALSPTNIVNNQLTYDKDNTYISMSKYEESPEIMIKRGDVIFVKTGSTVGKVAYVDKMICKTTLNPQVVVLKEIKCDNYILSVIMSTRKFQNKIQRITVGGAVPTLSQMAMGNIFISLPAAKEQEKISKFISLIDERIATQNKIIDKLQSLIKGIVDCTILRKEKNAIVGDVCSISEQIRAEANIDDIITVRLHGNGVCKSSAENLQLGATQYYRRRAGQLIYGKQNFHNGAIGIVPISLDNGITSKDIPSFDIDEMKCNSVYLLAQLQSPQYYKPAEALTTGTGSKRLKEETFLKMPIVLPNKREQDNIAVLIHRASMNLDYAKRLLELLSIQKQFLLRQMFI